MCKICVPEFRSIPTNITLLCELILMEIILESFVIPNDLPGEFWIVDYENKRALRSCSWVSHMPEVSSQLDAESGEITFRFPGYYKCIGCDKFQQVYFPLPRNHCHLDPSLMSIWIGNPVSYQLQSSYSLHNSVILLSGWNFHYVDIS